jgi:hypothetical protein
VALRQVTGTIPNKNEVLKRRNKTGRKAGPQCSRKQPNIPSNPQHFDRPEGRAPFNSTNEKGLLKIDERDGKIVASDPSIESIGMESSQGGGGTVEQK